MLDQELSRNLGHFQVHSVRALPALFLKPSLKYLLAVLGNPCHRWRCSEYLPNPFTKWLMFIVNDAKPRVEFGPVLLPDNLKLQAL